MAGREALLRRTIWDARAQATGLFFELWMLDRVRAGMAMGHHDALGAEAEIARMEAERSSLDDERAAMAAMLNTLRGHADDPSVPRVGLPKRAAVPRLDALAGKAASTPEVTAARAMRGEAEAKRELAKKMYLPMVSLEAMYKQRLEGERDTWDEVAMAEAMIGAHGARRTRCARWPRPSSAWPGAGCAPRTGG